MKTIDRNECAKMIKAALKAGFPLTKFSVKQKVYSMGHSIDVYWTDGPTGAQVKPILDRFESKGFDGMTDCSYYCGERVLCGVQVEVSGGYVRGNRSTSAQLRAKVIDKLAYECGLGPVSIDKWGNVDRDVHVPFQWHSHWLPYLHEGTDSLERKPLTVDDLEGEKTLLAHDSHQGEYFSRLVYSIEGWVSLEEQKPIPAELLPEYIDVKATVSTGRASWEEPMQKFQGHAALELVR